MNIQELYLKTIFCCMACDGDIAQQEIAIVQSLAKDATLFGELHVEECLNSYVETINSKGIAFLKEYLQELKDADLDSEEQFVVLKLALQTIEADEKLEYSEVKFFKKIRAQLSLTDEQILVKYPDKEEFLLPDINVSDFIELESNITFNTINLV